MNVIDAITYSFKVFIYNYTSGIIEIATNKLKKADFLWGDFIIL